MIQELGEKVGVKEPKKDSGVDEAGAEKPIEKIVVGGSNLQM